MIREPVLHPTDMPMIIIEHTRVALPRAAVVHDNELPAMPFHRRAPDCFDDRTCQVTIADRATPRPETESARWRRRRRLETLVLLNAGFFDDNLSLPAR